MRHEEFVLTTSDKLSLFGQFWSPDEDPTGVIVLVHGFGEHSTRYKHWAEKFVSKNFAWVTFDLRGHGKSPGKPGYIPSYEILLEDIDCLLEKIKILYPDIPVYLYGHSMGGNLVLNYAIERNPDIKGLIATSPWLRLKKELPGILLGMLRFFYNLFPGLIIPSGLDAKGISRDQEVVRNYIEDPLVHGKISLRLFLTIHDQGLLAIKRAEEIAIPLCIMQGSADLIVDPEASREFAEGVTKEVTFKEWNGLYHETHNEPEKEEVFDFLMQWLKIH